MDSGKAKKRPWESDILDNTNTRRRHSPARSTYNRSPLPQHAGQHPHDNENVSLRRLPPLYTSASSTAIRPLIESSIQPSLLAHDLPNFGPRAQFLFDPPQQVAAGEWHSSIPESSPRVLNRDQSPPTADSISYPSQFGTNRTSLTAGKVTCCSSGCTGQECIRVRAVLHQIAAELVLLNSRVGLVLQNDHQHSTEPPNLEEVSLKETLQWALDTVGWANSSLQNHIDHSSYSPDQNKSQQDTTSAMRRGPDYKEALDDQSPPNRHYAPPYHGYNTLTDHAVPQDTSRSNPYNSELPPTANSPLHTASSSGSVFIPPHSPMQMPQPTRFTMLPATSSMQFSSATILPPISPPSTTATQVSAHSTLLQDLQHQISVKTIALQTLQREYDSLLQKLDRQRLKCATLEKKFEVSDVEINSLTDEKEKLQAQVSALELQVEELQENRDESRRQLVANGAQYMRIMEMANRLQAQGADDKKRWDGEKAELQSRIRVLEEAMVTGGGMEHPDRSSPPSIILAHTSGTTASSSAETVNVLRAEISRLRIRTQTLEASLKTMKEEALSIQEAARKLLESSGKIEHVSREVLG